MARLDPAPAQDRGPALHPAPGKGVLDPDRGPVYQW